MMGAMMGQSPTPTATAQGNLPWGGLKLVSRLSLLIETEIHCDEAISEKRSSWTECSTDCTESNPLPDAAKVSDR